MNNWIDVNDRLPEPKQRILMVSDSGQAFSGRGSVLISTNELPEPSFGRRGRYTYWMPFPELPEEYR